jgi:hypothetical protein
MFKKLTLSAQALLCLFVSVNYDFRFNRGKTAMVPAWTGIFSECTNYAIGVECLVGKNRVVFEYGAGNFNAYFTAYQNRGN